MDFQKLVENYYGVVREEAETFFADNIDDILDAVENDYNIYEIIYDNLYEFVDNAFIYVGLKEAAIIIEESSNVEEGDGLWAGQQPEDAIVTKAFYTFKNDLREEVFNMLRQELEDKIAKIEERIEEIEYDEYYDEEEKEAAIEYLEEQKQKYEDALEDIR